jgi:hypothetical protein
VFWERCVRVLHGKMFHNLQRILILPSPAWLWARVRFHLGRTDFFMSQEYTVFYIQTSAWSSSTWIWAGRKEENCLKEIIDVSGR